MKECHLVTNIKSSIERKTSLTRRDSLHLYSDRIKKDRPTEIESDGKTGSGIINNGISGGIKKNRISKENRIDEEKYADCKKKKEIDKEKKNELKEIFERIRKKRKENDIKIAAEKENKLEKEKKIENEEIEKKKSTPEKEILDKDKYEKEKVSFIKLFFERKGSEAEIHTKRNVSSETKRRRIKKVARGNTPKDQKSIRYFFGKENEKKVDVETPSSAKRKRTNGENDLFEPRTPKIKMRRDSTK